MMKQSAELPAGMHVLNCMTVPIAAGSNIYYYDPFQQKKYLGPEFGGDGKKTAGGDAQDPVVAFPGSPRHQNACCFIPEASFLKKLKNGCVRSFPWFMEPGTRPQQGFYVVFVPFADGKQSGKWGSICRWICRWARIGRFRQSQTPPVRIGAG